MSESIRLKTEVHESSATEHLRQQAELRLSQTLSDTDPRPAEADVRALIHELQVHQIELEMQNEELMRAQAAAQYASEKYYDLFDFAPVGYFLWDNEARIVDVNLAGAALLGLDRNAAVGTTFAQFLATEYHEAFAEFCQNVLASEQKLKCEVKMLGAQQPREVLIEGIAAQDRPGSDHPVSDRVPQEGKLCRAAVVDVTQQKRAADLAAKNKELQEAQRRAESYRDRYIDLYDNAPLGYATLDEDGYIQEINLAGANLLGCNREDLAGYEFSNYVVATDRRVFLDHVRKCCGERVEVTSEINLASSDGRTITVQVHSIPIAHEGHEGTFCKTAVTDITARKQAEENLRESMNQNAFLASVIENAAQPFGVGYADGRLGIVNKAFERLTGYTSEELRSIDWFNVLTPPEWREPELRQLAELMRSGQPARFEKEYLRKDGTRVPVELLLHLARGSAGEPDCFYSFVTDLTDRKRITGELQNAKAVAEAANAAKSQFLANISHELRTPMNAILGMIDVALPKAMEPRVRDCLETAKGSAGLLLSLLNNLLDSAKVESGKLELESAPFSLKYMLDQVTRILSMRAGEKGLKFYCHMSDSLPDAVVGDRIRLQQVLLNLAENAIKFTERGEVEISACPLSQDDEACVRFMVRDTGVGIPEASLERLFQPFVQVDSSMTRQFGGTGLGLSICKSLVELMGGCISVETEQGQGSTFSFTLRLPVAPDLPQMPEIPDDLAPPSAPLRILLAEDNPANQKLATYILQDRGHLVDVANDGHAAVALSRQTRYDVILMDVQMPGMDGLDATISIRKAESGGRRAPILAMTAHALSSDRDRCLAAGMDAYISKPVDRRELIETVERMGNTGWAQLDFGPTEGNAGPVDRPTRPAIYSASPDPAPPANAQSSAAQSSTARAELSEGALQVFNVDRAVELAGGEPSLFRDMVAFFFRDGPKTIQEIDAAVQSCDAKAVSNRAHFLKGTVLHLGAASAEKAVARVENLGRSGTMQGIVEAVESMKTELALLGEALRPYAPADHEFS